jgi:hypothetical protein
MMDIMRETLGEDRIVGFKFPRDRGDIDESQLTPEQLEMYQRNKPIRDFLETKRDPQLLLREEKTKDMNPYGFWEHPAYSVRGITYRGIGNADFLEGLLEEPKDKLSICKIVSQGLFHSDPRFIDKIVYMDRHPRAVAKSQERLQRGFDIQMPDGTTQNIFEDLTIHTPEMYIQVTVMAAHWLSKYPDIPVLFVDSDDLIKDPATQLQRIQDFLGEGDFSQAVDRIDPSLWRSYPEDVEHKLWEDSEFVHDHFTKGEYQEIIDYMQDPRRETHREKRNWPCVRSGHMVVESQCKLCMANVVNLRKNFKAHAEQNGIEWNREPCLYECGLNLDAEPVSIEESINNNFWEREEDATTDTERSSDEVSPLGDGGGEAVETEPAGAGV